MAGSADLLVLRGAPLQGVSIWRRGICCRGVRLYAWGAPQTAMSNKIWVKYVSVVRVPILVQGSSVGSYRAALYKRIAYNLDTC